MLGVGCVHALGVGRPQTVSSIGEPLNLLFPLNLAAGESISLDCVQAKVLAGESRIPTQSLRLQLDSRMGVEAHSVRLQSTVPISEPVVSVELTVGCNGVRFTRQFTALIDPPLDPRSSGSETAMSMPVAPAPVVAETTITAPAGIEIQAERARQAPREADAHAPVPPPVRTAQAPGQGAKAAVGNARRQTPHQAPAAARAAAVPASVAPATIPTVVAAAPTAATSSASRQPAADKASAPVAAASAPEVRTVARLQLDPLDDLSSGAAAASPEAMAEEKRLAALESEIAAMRKSTDDFHAGIQALRGRLEAERSERSQNPLVYGLMLLALALLAAGAWMWKRLVFVQAQQAAWWAGAGEDAELPPAAAPVPQKPMASSGASFGVPPAVAPVTPKLEPNMAAKQAEAPSVSPQPVLDAEPVKQGAAEPSFKPQWDEPVFTPAYASPKEQAVAEFLGEEPPGDSTWALPEQVRAPEDEALSLTPLSGYGDMDVLSPAQQQHSAAQLLTTPELAHIRVEELIDLDQQVDFFLVLGQDDAAIDLLTEHIGRGDAGNALAYLKLLEIMQHHNDEAGFQRIANQFAKRFQAWAPTWNENLSEGAGLGGDAATMRRIQVCWPDSGAAMALLQDLLARGGDQGTRFDLAAYRDILMLYAVARDLSEHEVRDDQIDVFLPLDLDIGNEPSASMMATMVWEGTGHQGDTYPVDLDLSLDEPKTPPPDKA
ncbi:MAG: hypothetical protein JOY60_15960 [Burkholderiaceae bacterium]|nr:hypothetical protein [Burkholderiaceae bacterium]